MSARCDSLLPMPEAVRSAEHNDELTHVTQPDDDDRSLCGLDVSGHPWDPEGQGPECVVCLDLEASLLAWGGRP